jgi:tetratricopeptide (TPR) repeat protein
MIDWLREQNYSVLLVVGLVIAIGGFLIITGTVSSTIGTQQNPVKVLDRLGTKLQEHPYDPALLLESARYHYELVRDRLQSNADSSELTTLVREGLTHYRRLISNPDWSLDRRDYFYAAYLYFTLGESYYDRAKSLALESYQKGYRSRSLVTLLANIEYHQATSKEDYKVALNYYESLGPDVRDPVLLYNKAQTLRQVEEFQRAYETLERGEQFLEAYSNSEDLLSKYRLAKVQLNVQRERFGEALSFIRTIPAEQRNLKLRTLYAQCLIEVGQVDRARAELKDVVDQPGSPREAELLLNEITKKPKKARS